MFAIFVCLLLVGALNAKVIRHQRDSSCSSDDECDGSLTCQGGQCRGGVVGDDDTCSPSGELPGTG